MKRILPLVTVIALLITCLVITTVPAAAIEVSRTYTLNADFDEGILDGVEHDTTPDQLQLSEEQTTLPFIWVANSNESTVSKINTETGVELARYRTGPLTGAGENPSRTTVDANGDLWVGNRNTASAVKIALNPTEDTNGDGEFKTSTGPADILPWGEDDAVLFRITAPAGTRALAIDASNNVWIGGTGSGPSFPMNCYDGETGALITSVNINRMCYGALIDGNGTLWVSNQSTGYITRVDDLYGAKTVTAIPTGDGWVYGIGIDSDGYIYTSAYTSNRIRKLDPATNTWLYSYYNGALYGGRGICVGLDGDVWVADSLRAHVTRHNASDGTIKADISVGSTPTGVAVASDGKIWVTNYGSSSVMRIDPATNTVDLTQGGHPGPYNYSDMTGMIVRNITTKVGTWTVNYDSGEAETIWGNVSWSSDTPAGTSIELQVRSSEDAAIWSAWETVTNGVDMTATPIGRYLQIQTTLKITSGDISPVLYDLTVTGDLANSAPVAVINVADDTIPLPVTMKVTPQTLNLDRLGKWVKAHLKDDTANTVQEMEVTLDGSASSDPDGDTITYDWTLTDAEGNDIAVDDVMIPTVILTSGTYVVSLVVNDGELDSAEATASFTLTDITVADLLATDPGDYELNGVPGSKVNGCVDCGVIVISFEDDAIAGTVVVGLDQVMTLSGAASGTDQIDVIQDNGKSDLK